MICMCRMSMRPTVCLHDSQTLAFERLSPKPHWQHTLRVSTARALVLSDLYQNVDGETFMAVTNSAAVGSSSERSQRPAFADLNNDGWIDLIVTNHGSSSSPVPDRLYLGSSSGFTEPATDPFGGVTDSLASRFVSAADYDQDGDADVFITGEFMLAFRNNGGVFTRDTSCAFCMTATRETSWGDYDGALLPCWLLPASNHRLPVACSWSGDGYVDVFLFDISRGNYLFQGLGGGSFVRVTPLPAGETGYATGAAWGDFKHGRPTASTRQEERLILCCLTRCVLRFCIRRIACLVCDYDLQSSQQRASFLWKVPRWGTSQSQELLL